MSRIEVSRRAGGWSDRARKYKVLVDGEEVATVGAGESVGAEVDAGEHELQLKLDWCRSRPQTVTLSASETARFECHPNSNPLTVLYYISLGADNYIGLSPAPADEATAPPPGSPPPPPPS